MRRTNPPRRPSRPAGVLLLFALGCSDRGSVTPSDPAEARAALLAVLDAWKGGEAPDALARRSPAIHASDGDWKSGLRLLGYRADGEGKLVGSDVHYSVALELKVARGKIRRKTAVYAVTTRPRLLVLRQDD